MPDWEADWEADLGASHLGSDGPVGRHGSDDFTARHHCTWRAWFADVPMLIHHCARIVRRLRPRESPENTKTHQLPSRRL
jgi:hypothetical protein